MSGMGDDFRNQTVISGSLKLGRLALVFAVLSFAFVLVLASAPLRPYLAEWRSVQSRYNEMARSAGSPPVALSIKQIWKPQLGIADRCVTCHLGMGAAPAIGGDRLFREHPPVPHDPKQFGCTVCHGGQGRATARDDAHGFVSHWDEQMLDRNDLAAGCAACHDRVPVVPLRELMAGLRTIESLDCLSCHELDGRGRGLAPDLTTAGMRTFPADWHARHLLRHERRESPEWIASYGPINPADLAVIDAVLRTRVGMDRVVQARALAMERGCLGCHKLDGRGGDEGPALDGVGLKPIGDLNFRGVGGPETITNYMRTHLVDPARVVPGSQMPALGYTSEEADLLTTFLVSLRRRDLPLEFTPRDRLRRRLDVGAPPPMTGEQLFRAYCSACHGPNGEGRNYPATGVRFPRIASPDFLDIASDEFIATTLELGRPGRRMPALAAPGATLNKEDVQALIAHLRTLPSRFEAPPRTEDGRDLTRLQGNPAAGRGVFETVCAGCHGAKGEGKIGPALANPGFQKAATQQFVALTILRGRAGTPMPAFAQNNASYPRLTEADAADVAAFVTSGLK